MVPRGSTEDMLNRAMRCRTPQELVELAEKHNVQLSEREAANLLSILHPQGGTLSDTELDLVTGGGAKDPGICPSCGVWFEWKWVKDHYVCLNCGYHKNV